MEAFVRNRVLGKECSGWRTKVSMERMSETRGRKKNISDTNVVKVYLLRPIRG